MSHTLQPGMLSVASAYPDPPFDILNDRGEDGFDIELMKAICAELTLSLNLIHYTGENFNNIFDGLANHAYDAVISGTTITPERSARVLFSKPYLQFNQGVAVNKEITKNVTTLSDLKGLIAGIQHGNTSDAIAKKLLAEGIIADIHYYSYHKIGDALEDLNAGRIGFIIKLFPVISSFVKPYPKLSVALQVPTKEQIAIAFAKDNQLLCNQINQVIEVLKKNGTFARIEKKWFPK